MIAPILAQSRRCAIGLALAFLLLWPSACLWAQRYATAQISPALSVQAEVVYRTHEATFEVLSLEEAVLSVTRAVTIFRAAGDAHAVWYDYESPFCKLKILEGKVFDAQGKLLRSSRKSDIKDFGNFEEYAFADERTKTLDMKHTQYPYTVEFRVKKTIKGFFRVPQFVVQPDGAAVEQAVFKVVVPPDYLFRWKGIHTAVQPTIQPEGDKVAWTWVFNQIRASPAEVFAPQEAEAAIWIAPKQVSIGGFKGSFEDWQQTGRFFYDLNKGRTVLSPETMAQARALTEHLPSRRAKIAALYRHVQQTCRYISIQIGIGGWQTFDAHFVETKKYGDCKALSNYMQALLAAVDIPAHLALVYGDSDGAPALFDEAPVPLFNHAILYVPDEDMWLECTSRTHPAGYLGPFTAARPALLLTSEGGRLVRTPALTESDNMERSRISLKVGADGVASVAAHLKTTGANHDDYRALAAQTTKTVEQFLVQTVGVSVSKFDLLAVSASPDTASAELRYNIMTGNLCSVTGQRLFVPLLRLHNFQRSLPANARRSCDLVLRDAYTYADTVCLYFPEGYAPESLPKPKVLESVFGHYELLVEKSDDKLIVVRHLTIKPVSAPPEQYAAVRQFYADIAKLELAQAVLVRL